MERVHVGSAMGRIQSNLGTLHYLTYEQVCTHISQFPLSRFDW